MGQIRIGVAGVGSMGKNHCRVLDQLKGIDFVGVFDINPDSSNNIAFEYGVIPFKTFAEMVSAIDAVIIAVPTSSHFTYIRDAILHKKHVFVEKPFVSSLPDADVLLELSIKNRDIVVQVGHIERFNAAIQCLDQLIDSRKVVSLESHRSSKTDRGFDVDVVLDLLIHDIDIVLHLVNSPVNSVYAVGRYSLKQMGRLEIVHALITFENGVIANLSASCISTKSIRTLIVSEVERVFQVNYQSRELLIYQEPKTVIYPVENLVEKVKVSPKESLQSEIQQFIRSIRSRKSPDVGPNEATDALTIAMLIKESINKKELVMTNCKRKDV